MGKEAKESVGGIGTVIKRDGIFDLDTLYDIASIWATARGYTKKEKDMTRKVAADGGEYKIKWALSKKADDYVKYDVETEVWVWKGIEVIVENEGKQLKRVKGTVEITITSKMTKNYEKDFPPTRQAQFIRRLVERFLWKQRLGKHEEKLYFDVIDLQERYKKALEQYT
ncbi:MAG: hypothetical protein Q7R96_01420 [Nanoarchaeota archaeon]|nr:hypothetical protein [Nanoarchaeota archaeon]